MAMPRNRAAGTKWYKVKYDDNDEEELTLEELEAVLVPEGGGEQHVPAKKGPGRGRSPAPDPTLADLPAENPLTSLGAIGSATVGGRSSRRKGDGSPCGSKEPRALTPPQFSEAATVERGRDAMLQLNDAAMAAVLEAAMRHAAAAPESAAPYTVSGASRGRSAGWSRLAGQQERAWVLISSPVLLTQPACFEMRFATKAWSFQW